MHNLFLGDDGCKVPFDLGFTANVCCTTDLCNSATQIPIAIVAMAFMILIAMINWSYFF
jgi:hypothetical protein